MPALPTVAGTLRPRAFIWFTCRAAPGRKTRHSRLGAVRLGTDAHWWWPYHACGDAATCHCLQARPIGSRRLTHLDPPQLIVVKVARGHQVILHGVHVQHLDANGGGEGRLHDGQIELGTWSGKQRE
jgi:hypothetical protein